MNTIEILGFITRILQLLQLVSASVTSWFRDEDRNRTKGGAPDSLHLSGLAMDLVPGPGLTTTELATEAWKLGLHPLDEGTHVHIQDRPLRGNKRGT